MLPPTCPVHSPRAQQSPPNPIRNSFDDPSSIQPHSHIKHQQPSYTHGRAIRNTSSPLRPRQSRIPRVRRPRKMVSHSRKPWLRFTPSPPDALSFRVKLHHLTNAFNYQASALITNSDPSNLGQLWVYLINQPEYKPPEKRRTLNTRLREFLLKQWITIGVPCVFPVLATSQLPQTQK